MERASMSRLCGLMRNQLTPNLRDLSKYPPFTPYMPQFWVDENVAVPTKLTVGEEMLQCHLLSIHNCKNRHLISTLHVRRHPTSRVDCGSATCTHVLRLRKYTGLRSR
jgi:hypothetical protein